VKLNDVAALLIARGGVQGAVIKRSDRVWRGMWTGLLQDTRLRGVLFVFAPRPGVWWELCRCGSGVSSVMGGVIWLARLGMHLRGERACAKPLSSLNALDAGVVAVTRLHVRAKGRPAMEGVMR